MPHQQATHGGLRETPERERARGDGQVDADRLLYADAFRRLAGVTQVLTPRDDLVHHDRLTHSLKVAQVARRMSEHLNSKTSASVDPDTVHAAALAHDVGHPPFGHAGERELQDILEGRVTSRSGDRVEPQHAVPVLADSFEGNAQTFRLLSRITFRREGQGTGLNWTYRSLGAVSKYPWTKGGHSRDSLSNKWGAYDSEASVLERTIEVVHELGLWTGERSVEADVMDWSDDIAYAVHDIEDFHRAQSIPLARLRQDDEEWDEYLEFLAPLVAYKGWGEDDLDRVGAVVREHLPSRPFRGTERNRYEIRDFAVAMTRLLTDELDVSARGLVVPQQNRMAAEILKKLTWRYVIHRPDVEMMQRGQRRMVRELLWDLRELTCEHVGLLDSAAVPMPPRLVSYTRLAVEQEPGYDRIEQRITRAVVDFLCSLTDRQAALLHARLTGEGTVGVGHDWLSV